MEITNEVKEVISKDPALCDYWAAASKCFYPNEWRKSKLSREEEDKLPKCNPNGICQKCKPDSTLCKSRPNLYKKG